MRISDLILHYYYRGWTVLHLAARHSKPQTVRRLLDQVMTHLRCSCCHFIRSHNDGITINLRLCEVFSTRCPNFFTGLISHVHDGISPNAMVEIIVDLLHHHHCEQNMLFTLVDYAGCQKICRLPKKTGRVTKRNM